MLNKYNEQVTSINVWSDTEVGSVVELHVALDFEDAIAFAIAFDYALGFCEARDFRVDGRMLAEYKLERNQEIAMPR